MLLGIPEQLSMRPGCKGLASHRPPGGGGIGLGILGLGIRDLWGYQRQPAPLPRILITQEAFQDQRLARLLSVESLFNVIITEQSDFGLPQHL